MSLTTILQDGGSAKMKKGKFEGRPRFQAPNIPHSGYTFHCIPIISYPIKLIDVPWFSHYNSNPLDFSQPKTAPCRCFVPYKLLYSLRQWGWLRGSWEKVRFSKGAPDPLWMAPVETWVSQIWFGKRSDQIAYITTLGRAIFEPAEASLSPEKYTCCTVL
jgi:hypothetical protein